MASQNHCPKCGKPRKDSDIDCPYCGIVYRKYEAIQERNAETPEPNPLYVPPPDKKKTEFSKGVALLKYMIVGTACLWFFLHNYMPEKEVPTPPPPKPVAAKPQPTAAEKAALAAKREAERAERQRQKAEEYERCKIDLQCWGERHVISAASASQGMIERMAKYDFEWIDGFWKTKLSRWRWLDENKYTLVYFGDQIKLQNGFGAWQRCIYKVAYDPINDRVLDVEVSPGRL